VLYSGTPWNSITEVNREWAAFWVGGVLQRRTSYHVFGRIVVWAGFAAFGIIHWLSFSQCYGCTALLFVSSLFAWIGILWLSGSYVLFYRDVSLLS